VASRQEWWLLLRRSFGIPDVVTDEHARQAIGYATVGEDPPGELGPVALHLLDALLDTAPDGTLDGYLIALPGVVPDDVVDDISNRVPRDSAAGGLRDWAARVQTIQKFLDSLKKYLVNNLSDTGVPVRRGD
jgi:hypothetical protein